MLSVARWLMYTHSLVPQLRVHRVFVVNFPSRRHSVVSVARWLNFLPFPDYKQKLLPDLGALGVLCG